MKRVVKTMFYTVFISLLTFVVASGQEKKSEKKIKIVIADGSGTKVIADTILRNGIMKDSLILDNGKVIIIGRQSDDLSPAEKESSDHVFVTVTTDGEKSGTKVKTITIVSSDTLNWTEEGENGKMYVINDSHSGIGKTDGTKKVIMWNEKSNNNSDEKVVIVKGGKHIVKESGDSFSWTDESESMGTNYEKTKYVIKNDGMVITIEGDDYNKVKELSKEIESKMSFKSEDQESKRGKKK